MLANRDSGLPMHISQAQREMRSAFLGGFVGQLVSAVLWGIAAALATWGERRYSIGFLVIAGMFISEEAAASS